MGRTDSGRPRRRRGEGRASRRGRRHPRLGSALPQGQGRTRYQRRRLFPRRSTAASARSPSILPTPKARASCARSPRAPTSCWRISRPARWRNTASATRISSAVNPALIYCSITGFGQSGPRRDQAAYDFMIQGMSGLMSVTGEADGKPGRRTAEGRRAHRRHHDRDVRRDRRAGGAGAAAGERPGRAYRHRHARRRRVVSRQPGHELPDLGAGAAARRQRASEHPAAGRVRRRATATSCSRSATTTSSPGSATCSSGRTSPGTSASGPMPAASATMRS